MLRKINYVEVEIMSTSNLNFEKKGLLTGLTIDNTKVYVRILENAVSNLYFNTRHYSVKRLKIVHTEGTEQTFYMLNKKDQTNAVNNIKDVILEMRESGQVDREGAVIMTKYNGLPSQYLSERAENFKKKTNVFGLNNQLPATTKPILPAKTIYNTKIYQPPVKKVTYIRRKTKKPSEKFLVSMKKKVAKITEGMYKEKKLPKTDEVYEHVKSVGQSMYDADDYEYMDESNRFYD